MRKAICFFDCAIVAILLLSLCSCEKKIGNSSIGNNTNIINNDTEHDVDFDPYSDQPYFIKLLGSAPSMVSSESGYYFIRGAEGAKFLYYTDKATMKTVTLCNKPDCLHADENDPIKRKNCSAFLNDSKDTVGDLLFYDSYLYCARGKLGIDQPMVTTLTQIALDGTQRKELYTFKDYPQYMIIHRGFLYYETSDEGTLQGKEDSTSSKTAVYRIPINDFDKAPELVYEYNGIYSDIGPLTGYENNIYFKCYRYTDAKMEKLESILVHYNIESGKSSVISNIRRRNAICGGKLVYSIDEHKYICDLDGSNMKILDEVMGDMDCDDKYLLTDTIALFYEGVKDKQGNPIKKYLYVYDLNGKPLQAFDLELYHGASILGSDSNYIFLTTYSTTVENEIEYWRIDKNKIANGSAKMEKYYSYTEYSVPQ